ncbi:acyltransferase family protein [Flavobacterium phycosphaerae]|uniref:acyltransferase family protein n=1 Tax=Flavobacterium phycosphaerae TaxID=2697515 RepID=UPI00138A6C87|nr:acyltransferase [Flavobacterium phycosphaerae]
MNDSIYLYLIPVFIVLWGTTLIINKFIKLDLLPVKYPEIDGVRGYLAFFVFLHHSYIWQQYLQTKEWNDPNSNLFTHFGQTSVVLFFIITAFLFITKVLESKTDFDWNHYLKSRFFRLFPMYLCVVLVVFIMAGSYTHWKKQDSILNLIKSTSSWLFFTVNGATDINGFDKTFLMNSGVTWTLPYEWMFYFLLPIFALLLRKKVAPIIVLLFTFVFLIILYINQASIRHFMPFIGGIVAAILLKKFDLKPITQKPVFTFIALALLTCSVVFFDSGRKPIPIIISTLFFIIIASGNSFFGLLTSSLSRKLGQITYSLYLIHGTLLFIIFYGIIGVEQAAKLSSSEYWGIIAVSVIPLLFLSQLTFKYIELPMMHYIKIKKS